MATDPAAPPAEPATRHLALVAILVPDYDSAIAFFTGTLGFALLEDTDLGGGKRWVRVAPSAPGITSPAASPPQTAFLLARAVDNQRDQIGKQGGGRVWLFLQTDDFARDHAAYQAAGLHFEESPRLEPYGTVAVFQDPWGNRWDLIQFH